MKKITLILMLISITTFAQLQQSWLTLLNNSTNTVDQISGFSSPTGGCTVNNNYGGSLDFIGLNNLQTNIGVAFSSDCKPNLNVINCTNGVVNYQAIHNLSNYENTGFSFDDAGNALTLSSNYGYAAIGSNIEMTSFLRSHNNTGNLVYSDTIRNGLYDKNGFGTIKNTINQQVIVYGLRRLVSNGFYTSSTLCYNSAGILQWSSVINDLDWYYGYPGKMTMDINHNAIFSGKKQTVKMNANTYDIVLRKVNSSGVQQWQISYDFGGVSDFIKCLVTDNAGDVYMITENINQPNFAGTTNRLVKINGQTGAILFEQLLTSASAGALAINADGKIIYSESNKIKCLNPNNGSLLWSRQVSNFVTLNTDANSKVYATLLDKVVILNNIGTSLDSISIAIPSFTTKLHSVQISSDATMIYVLGERNGNGSNKVFVAKYNTCTPPTTPTITGNTTICNGSNTTFTASATGTDANTTYSWSGPNSFSATTASTGNINDAGTYTCVISNGSGCTASVSEVLVVNSVPTVTITGSAVVQMVCNGNSVTLTANGADTYLWNTNETTSIINPTILSNATNIGFSVTGTSNGCSATATKFIDVKPSPTVSIINTNLLTNCAGTPINIQASASGGSTGNQIFVTTMLGQNMLPANNSITSSGSIAAHLNTSNSIELITNSLSLSGNITSAFLYEGDAATNGTIVGSMNYPVGVNTINGMSVIISITAVQQGALLAGNLYVQVNTTQFPNGEIRGQLATSSTAYLYNWTKIGAGNLPETIGVSQSVNFALSTSNTYTVTVTDDNGCTASDNVSFTVIPTPLVTITGTSTICNGTSTSLTASGAASYSWSNNATSAAISVSPITNTTYTVTGTSNGCSATASQLVTVNNCNTLPQGSFPANQCGFVNNLRAKNGIMKCNAVAGAIKYLIKFYTVGSSVVYTQKNSTTTVFNLVGLSPSLQMGTQYDVTVTPILAGNVVGVESDKCRMGIIAQPTPSSISATSLRNPFCVQNASYAPTVAINAAITCHPVSQASSYQFKFVNVANAANTILANSNYVNQRSLLPLGLTPGATYAVSVRATVLGVQAANFGTVCYIKMAGSAARMSNNSIETVDEDGNIISEEVITNIDENRFDVEAYPNPFNTEFVLNIVSSKAELATVTITDVTGKLVSSQSIATNTIASILKAELESGLYFVSIATTSGERKVLCLVKQ